MSESKRLAKRLIEVIHCSRSEAEKYIEGGWVLVNGEIIDLPQHQVTDEVVSLHPEANLKPVEPKTLLLNLPVDFDMNNLSEASKLITPETRFEFDDPGVRTLRRHFSRLKATIPLQEGACGLLVFTQDGRVVKRLVQDASKNEQEYIVEVGGEMAEDGLDYLNSRITQNKYAQPIAKVSWQSEHKLRFALKNPRPGQLAQMCEHVGLSVVSMTRIRIGRIPMGKLPPGQWRYVPDGKLF